MLRTSLSSAVLVVLVWTSGGCAQNPPANAATAPAASETAATPPPAGSGMMGAQGMMGGQGMMGSGMMDGGQGMMSGRGMTGGSGMMGPSTMDGGQGMTGGHGMMGGGGMMGMGDQCPMFVAGTTVQAKDTNDGMTMTFTTTGDIAELRRRVRVMADHMSAHASGGMGMHGMGMGSDAGMATMGGSMMGGGMMPAMHAQVDDVDHGARMKMKPADPAKLSEMRQQMKQHVQMMNQSHGCSMMADGGA